MEERKSAWDVRRNFGSILRQVSTERTSVVIESHGQPVAVIVPLSAYRRDVQEREEMLTLLRAAQSNANMEELEAMKMALDLQREVRESRS